MKHTNPAATNANAGHIESQSEEFSIPSNIDLQGLPQLCFPGKLFIFEDHFYSLELLALLGCKNVTQNMWRAEVHVLVCLQDLQDLFILQL